MDAFVGLEFACPQGKVKVDEKNYTWLYSRIAQIDEHGEFQTIVESEEQPWSKLLFPDHEEPWK